MTPPPFASAPDSGDIYRVMIVDDSAVIRGAIVRALEDDPALKVVASVANGEQAIRALQRDPADVIVLDIEMPVMDGLTALPQLKAIDGAVQIIMASTLTQRNAEISLHAMSLGATDYIPKPTSNSEVVGASDFKRELLEKIKVLGALARRSGVRMAPSATASYAPPVTATPSPLSRFAKQPVAASGAKPAATPSVKVLHANKEVVLRKDAVARPDIIAIGSSTGGPQALFRVIKDMGADIPQPIVITQHMPPAFTAILAEHISRQCGVICVEAKDGDVLQPKHYYIAPGDNHMLITGKDSAPVVRLNKDAQENFCRPAVDPMLRSLVGVYGKRILTVILTGMGQDGMKGSEMVVKAGGSVVAQDEASSVVWGMPGAVATAGLCSAVMPVNEIGAFVRQAAMRPRT